MAIEAKLWRKSCNRTSGKAACRLISSQTGLSAIGFVSDAVKINVEQIFRQLSPSTDVKAI